MEPSPKAFALLYRDLGDGSDSGQNLAVERRNRLDGLKFVDNSLATMGKKWIRTVPNDFRHDLFGLRFRG